jgi:hypothetical protein
MTKTQTPIYEVQVQEFISQHASRHCEFTLTECQAAIAYTVTPIIGTPQAIEYTTFVCREHLGEVIALRLAGTYDVRPDRHDGCHHSREHDLDCDDERAR